MTGSTTPAVRPATVALFISDLHLQPELPHTTALFLRFLELARDTANQVFLLGDVFEYWAGDDDLGTPYHQQIVQALRDLSAAGVALYWVAGNRDFLVGEHFAQACHVTLLPDPFVLEACGQRYLLSHGDALCTDDTAYQQFRAMVRQPAWQSEFLAKPLAQRKQIIAGLRMQSRAHQQHTIQQGASDIMDVNPDAVARLFEEFQIPVLIHGHTHRPALHRAGATLRYVLSDWDCDGEPGRQRGDWLALLADGRLERHDWRELNQPDTNAEVK